ncbi:hypothetical protein [Parafrankia sp. CH37]|uniref:hypothetical protein n=1 Tax=Parafrankia sp. CH37 TaxID=683308 RepID=UPI001868698F|nr:hypothetical protein [Parafrankia sp. CH37]MBE3206609.1 hypothetical protein [Parafrankia sp. CH37]MBE3206615.1 hypothetical protein [Parafrankia sp. CH37]MBE3206621.1 hypothetical protein [Parafrankia sp. CH37]MBE3206627.1 hypothetical protein [Parafrankia sp. CH37]MBE3206637.1 hypothetical protein [Parafrankia sp. CH37]
MLGVIDFQLAGYLRNPVQLKSTSAGLIATLKLALTLPPFEKANGEIVEGHERTFTVTAFEPLSFRVRDAELNQLDWVIADIRDLRTRVWKAPDGKSVAMLDLTASRLQFRPERERVAELLSASLARQNAELVAAVTASAGAGG